MTSITDLLNNLGQQAGLSRNNQQSDASSAAQSSGFDLSSLLQGRGGIATGAAAGGLAGLLMSSKKTRRMAGDAVKIGGLALAGGLAFKAWQDWQAKKQGAPVAEPQKFLPPAADAQDVLARHLIGAMIAAARADGHITETERERIESQLSQLPMDDAGRAYVADALRNPPGIDDLVAYSGSPEESAEIYAASLLVIDADGPAEKGYLAMLAARLDLDPALVAELHAKADGLEGA